MLGTMNQTILKIKVFGVISETMMKVLMRVTMVLIKGIVGTDAIISPTTTTSGDRVSSPEL
jgi:hypothetical protein